MEIVELRVQVDKTQLTQLNAEIIKLKDQTIKINVESNGAEKLNATAQSANQATNSLKNTGSAAQEASKSATLLGDSIGNVAAKMAAWQVMGQLVAAPIAAFKDAVAELKNVDTELVTIQKVTGATATEMDRLAQSAYSTASELGATASAYLNAVSEFAKAGYGDTSEQLGELAIVAANVGDTTQQTANQFLLAVDAAYQYNGSISELTAVLDGANEIGNRYATDVQKMAEGLGKVAPIASQAGVGIDELTAAIGTVTAVTQRTGTEAATALRALFLNIMGDTKTEIADGAKWTAGEIEGLRDVLRAYAPDVVAAADATGQLINPMEAIGALAQAMEDGLLTEQKLMEMVSDIGGKLRTSQLLALIQNWDMYEGMLDTYANAAGSAAREYSIYLDSWEAKTNQLSATWTEFVSNIVDTGAVKGALDGLISVFEFLNTSAGQTVTNIALLTTAFLALQKAANLKFITSGAANLKAFVSLFAEAAVSANKFSNIMTLLNTTLFTSPLFLAAAGATALYGIVKLFDATTTSAEELQEQLSETGAELDELYSERDSLTEQSDLEGLNQIEKTRLELINQQISAKEKLQQITAQEFLDTKYGEETGKTDAHGRTIGGPSQSILSNVKDDVEEYKALTKEIENFTVAQKDGVEATQAQRDEFEETVKRQEELKLSLAETAEEMLTYGELAGGLSDEQQAVVDSILEMVGATEEQGDAATEAAAATAQASEEVSGLSGVFSEAEGKIEGTTEALKAYQEALQGGEKEDNFLGYAEAFDAINEEIERGTTNSNAFWEAAKLLFGDEMLSSVKYSSEAVAEFVKNIEPLYGDNESAGLGLLQAMEGIANAAGQIIDTDGTVIGEIQKLSDGTYSFEVPNENLGRLAEMLGTTEEGVVALIEAMSMWDSSVSLMDVDDIVSGLQEIGAATEYAGRSVVNMDALIASMQEAGKSGQEIAEVLARLDSSSAVVSVSMSDDVNVTIEKLKELGIAVESADGKTVTINYQAFIETAESAGFSTEEIESFLTAADKTGSVSFATASGEAASLKEALSGIGDVSVDIDMSGPMGALQDTATEAQTTKDKLTDLGDTTVSPTIELDKTAFDSGIASVESDLANLPTSKTITINVVTKEDKNAEGTDYYKGGTTLLGDEESPDGSPRPELVVTNKRAFIAGTKGPEIRTLPRGARIYNYKDTMEILERQGQDDEEFPAFAGGNIKLPSKYGGGGGKGSSSSSGSNGGSYNGNVSGSTWGGASGGGSSVVSGGVSSGVGSSWDAIANLQAELDALIKAGAAAEELKAKYDEINQTLAAINGVTGEVTSATWDWSGATEEVVEAQKGLYQDNIALLESEIQLMEYQGGQEEERIAKLQQIQALLHAQAEMMRSIGAAQVEINQLSIEWWKINEQILELQNAQAETTGGIWDNYEGQSSTKSEILNTTKQQYNVESSISDLNKQQESNERVVRFYNAATGQWEWTRKSDVETAGESNLSSYGSGGGYSYGGSGYGSGRGSGSGHNEVKMYAADMAKFDKLVGPGKSFTWFTPDLYKDKNRNSFWYPPSTWSDLSYDSSTGEYGTEHVFTWNAGDIDYQERMLNASDAAEFNHWAERNNWANFWTNTSPLDIALDPDKKTNQELWEEWLKTENGKQFAYDADLLTWEAPDLMENEKFAQGVEDYRQEKEFAEASKEMSGIAVDAKNLAKDALVALRETEDAAAKQAAAEAVQEAADLAQKAADKAQEKLEEAAEKARDVLENEDAASSELWSAVGGSDYGGYAGVKGATSVVNVLEEAYREAQSATDAAEKAAEFAEAAQKEAKKLADEQQMLEEDGIAVTVTESGKTADALEDLNDTTEKLLGEISDNINGLNKTFEDASTKLEQSIEEAAQEGSGSLGSGGSSGKKGSSSSSSSSGGGSVSYDASVDYTDLMLGATSEEEFNKYAAQREAKIEGEGIDLESSGYRTNDELRSEWESSRSDSSSSDSSSSDSSSSTPYDSGGILTGMGGIKATEKDEIVIPPDIAQKMLEPSADQTFQDRMAELGWLYGNDEKDNRNIPGMVQNRNSQDHYGDNYQFGDVSMSEQQAKSLTVYDLAQKAKNLSIYNWR